MGLSKLTDNLFTSAWRTALAPSVVAGMTATITVYDPETKGAAWTNAGGLVTDPDADIVTCAARVTPVSFSGPNGTSIQRIQFQIPWDATTTPLRVGWFVKVVTSPLNPTQLARAYSIVEVLNSSNPVVSTFEAESSNAYEAV